jgi:hypothetical protein
MMIKRFGSINAFISEKLLPACKRRFNAIFVLSIWLIAILILFGNRSSVYSIKGNTQTISLTTSTNQLNRWIINAGAIFTLADIDCAAELTEDNYLQLNNAQKVTITTEKTGDKTSYLIVARSDGNNVGQLVTPSKTCQLEDYLEISIDGAQSLTLPFEATTFIGEDVGTGVDKLLIDGSVDILEKQFFTAKRYIGETVELNMGDRIRLSETGSKGDTYAKGFLRFLDTESIYFSVTSQSDSVLIERFGSSTLTISPSIWSRITNDPFAAAFGSLLTLLFLLLEIFMAFNQIFKKVDSSNE